MALAELPRSGRTIRLLAALTMRAPRVARAVLAQAEMRTLAGVVAVWLILPPVGLEAAVSSAVVVERTRPADPLVVVAAERLYQQTEGPVLPASSLFGSTHDEEIRSD